MRVLFVMASGPSHLYPMVPLAWAFRAAGHEVRLAGKANSDEAMLHTGLSTVLVGRPQRAGRLAATGAAIQLRHQNLAADPAGATGLVGDAIGKLLSDNGYAVASDRLREDIEAMPAPAAVVDTLGGKTLERTL